MSSFQEQLELVSRGHNDAKNKARRLLKKANELTGGANQGDQIVIPEALKNVRFHLCFNICIILLKTMFLYVFIQKLILQTRNNNTWIVFYRTVTFQTLLILTLTFNLVESYVCYRISESVWIIKQNDVTRRSK